MVAHPGQGRRARRRAGPRPHAGGRRPARCGGRADEPELSAVDQRRPASRDQLRAPSAEPRPPRALLVQRRRDHQQLPGPLLRLPGSQVADVAIDLLSAPPYRDATEGRIWMPDENGEGGEERWTIWEGEPALKQLGAFGGSIFRTAQNWLDNRQMRVQGYRDRIAHVFLLGDEGGMNLRMDEPTVARLSGYGAEAAALLRHRFSVPAPTDDTKLTWDNQRWLRFRAFMELLEDTGARFRAGYDDAAAGNATMAELAARAAVAPAGVSVGDGGPAHERPRRDRRVAGDARRLGHPRDDLRGGRAEARAGLALGRADVSAPIRGPNAAVSADAASTPRRAGRAGRRIAPAAHSHRRCRPRGRDRGPRVPPAGASGRRRSESPRASGLMKPSRSEPIADVLVSLRQLGDRVDVALDHLHRLLGRLRLRRRRRRRRAGARRGSGRSRPRAGDPLIVAGTGCTAARRGARPVRRDHRVVLGPIAAARVEFLEDRRASSIASSRMWLMSIRTRSLVHGLHGGPSERGERRGPTARRARCTAQSVRNGSAGAFFATWRKKRCASVTYTTPGLRERVHVLGDLARCRAEVKATLDAMNECDRSLLPGPLQILGPRTRTCRPPHRRGSRVPSSRRRAAPRGP